ncbi:hypothetical protein [Arthrobacter pityocampae]|uniref:Uncharacterized protein n=1 Tax=Arthrobacter pityocampae TaxID=547334 RepID=A0A2S5J1R3_9MICC|nr:hypothetical protein [Arthrobacter pityocampae]PPB50769.1 hypothetical protein C4K88_02530 [Arthrobacter pityocampae]
MKILTGASRLTQFLLGVTAVLLSRSGDRERGDVPGWVMITLMSAVLVAALLAIAGPALEGLFNQAIDQVSP